MTVKTDLSNLLFDFSDIWIVMSVLSQVWWRETAYIWIQIFYQVLQNSSKGT